jgi:hypothetical protein
MSPKVSIWGIKPHCLYRQFVLVMHIELAPALGFSHADPARGLVTGAPESFLFHKSLKQNGSIVIPLLPVIG